MCLTLNESLQDLEKSIQHALVWDYSRCFLSMFINYPAFSSLSLKTCSWLKTVLLNYTGRDFFSFKAFWIISTGKGFTESQGLRKFKLFCLPSPYSAIEASKWMWVTGCLVLPHLHAVLSQTWACWWIVVQSLWMRICQLHVLWWKGWIFMDIPYYASKNVLTPTAL